MPHRLIREQLDARITERTIELFCKGERVAVHIRGGGRGRHTTIPEHMPSAHRRYAEWTIERIRANAAAIGPSTAKLVALILESRPHPEQGYRASIGVGYDVSPEALATALREKSYKGCVSLGELQELHGAGKRGIYFIDRGICRVVYKSLPRPKHLLCARKDGDRALFDVVIGGFSNNAGATVGGLAQDLRASGLTRLYRLRTAATWYLSIGNRIAAAHGRTRMGDVLSSPAASGGPSGLACSSIIRPRGVSRCAPMLEGTAVDSASEKLIKIGAKVVSHGR